jgi:GNAT superfamily N-acetyltransferase
MMEFRRAELSEARAMAQIRAREWQTEEFWYARISGYLEGKHNPRQALESRVMYVASEDGLPVGFIAGHLTRRYECDGELQWIDVVEERRRVGLASVLLKLLAEWFAMQGALRICVNVDVANVAARRLYMRFGAEELNRHWLLWKDIRVALG